MSNIKSGIKVKEVRLVVLFIIFAAVVFASTSQENKLNNDYNGKIKLIKGTPFLVSDGDFLN